MTRIRFLNGNEFDVVDGEPASGEVSRAQFDAFRAASIPMEVIKDKPKRRNAEQKADKP